MADDPDLYRLLGLPPDTDVEHLRYVYEQHVADAVRSHDHVRALRLSRAFDALGTDARRALYSGAGTRAPRFATGQAGRQTRLGSRRSAVPDSDKWWYGFLPRFRFVAALVVVPAVFMAVGVLVVSRNQPVPANPQVIMFQGPTSAPPSAPASSGPARTGPPLARATHVAPTPTVTPLPGEIVLPGYEFLRVPTDWPTGADGFVLLACDAPAGVGLTSQARPGWVLMCPIGSHLVRY